MAVHLALRFPAGRYHATPWGHHVNEGLIEWPPSPWRILRALLSTGYTAGVWDGDDPPETARSLFEKLAGSLPAYTLPPAVAAHSRHYMPLARIEKGQEKTTLVFDAWLRIDSEAKLLAHWPEIELKPEEYALLQALVARLGYMGRSESWVLGRVVDLGETWKPNCFLEGFDPKPDGAYEQVALLAAKDPLKYDAWREKRIAQALQGLPLPEGKKKPAKALLKKREEAIEPYPIDLIDCLQQDTNRLRQYGWSQPPGSRRILYRRPADAIEVGAPKLAPYKPKIEPVEAMLLALNHPNGNENALPHINRTLPQAELLHRSFGKKAPSVLTGKDRQDRPLRGAHEHAYLLPLDLNGDQHLDHILIWAKRGLDAVAQEAVRTVRRAHMKKEGDEPLRLALAGKGRLQDFCRLPDPYGDELKRIIAPEPATVWVSRTPFVPPRYLKKNGKNSLENQIRAELASRGLAEPASVEQLMPRPAKPHGEAEHASWEKEDEGKDWHKLRHFVFWGQNREPPFRCGFAVRIRFDKPVSGPMALGYGSHFGLGLFQIDDEKRTV